MSNSDALTALLAAIQLIEFLIGGMAALAGVLWGVSLWEIRQLRKAMHELNNNLPKLILQWAEVAIKSHRGGSHVEKDILDAQD